MRALNEGEAQVVTGREWVGKRSGSAAVETRADHLVGRSQQVVHQLATFIECFLESETADRCVGVGSWVLFVVALEKRVLCEMVVTWIAACSADVIGSSSAEHTSMCCFEIEGCISGKRFSGVARCGVCPNPRRIEVAQI